MDGYFFTLNCSLETPVVPAAEFQISETFIGNSTPIISDYITKEITNISETEWSITVKLNGSFPFPENGVIEVNCSASNPNGNDTVTTLVRRCGKMPYS